MYILLHSIAALSIVSVLQQTVRFKNMQHFLLNYMFTCSGYTERMYQDLSFMHCMNYWAQFHKTLLSLVGN